MLGPVDCRLHQLPGGIEHLGDGALEGVEERTHLGGDPAEDAAGIFFLAFGLGLLGVGLPLGLVLVFRSLRLAGADVGLGLLVGLLLFLCDLVVALGDLGLGLLVGAADLGVLLRRPIAACLADLVLQLALFGLLLAGVLLLQRSDFGVAFCLLLAHLQLVFAALRRHGALGLGHRRAHFAALLLLGDDSQRLVASRGRSACSRRPRRRQPGGLQGLARGSVAHVVFSGRCRGVGVAPGFLRGDGRVQLSMLGMDLARVGVAQLGQLGRRPRRCVQARIGGGH